MSSTLVLCIPAEGKALDTTLIWPQAHIPPEFHLFPLKDIHIYCQNSAYQTRKSFTSMMLDYYLPEMIRRRNILKKDNDPIILFLDGHSSRLSLPVIHFCAEHNIKLLILPAHTSSITQHLDRCSNGVLKKVFAALCSKLTNRAKREHPSTKPTAPIRSEDSEYIPSDSSPSPESEDETHSLKEHETEETPASRDRSDAEIAYEASELDESDSDDEDIQRIPEQFLPQSAFIFKPSASYERKLLAEILPAALRKATDYDVMRAGWKKSGLYPLDDKSPLEWLPSGEKCPERKTKMPLISGRDLTSPDVMMSIEKWAEGRNLKAHSKEDSFPAHIDQNTETEGTSEITTASQSAEPVTSGLESAGSHEAAVIHESANEELLGIEIESDDEDLRYRKRYAAQEEEDYLLEAYESQLRQQELDDSNSDQYTPSHKKESRIDQTIKIDDSKRIRRGPHYKKVPEDMMTW